MKKLLIVLTALLLCAALPIASLAQERGFASPEDCAQALMDALIAQDTQAMDACIAFGELAASFSFTAQAERLRAVLGSMNYLPADAHYAAAYNETLLRRAWYGRLAAFGLAEQSGALTLLFSGRSAAQGSVEYDAVLEAAQADYPFNIFDYLTYEGIVRPEEIASISEAYAGERNQESLRLNMAIWQVEAYTELGLRIATTVETRFSEGARYIIPVRFVQIGSRWLADPNLPNLGMLLGMSAVDFAVPLP